MNSEELLKPVDMSVERLLTSDEATLYKTLPSVIAQRVGTKLNEISLNGREATVVLAIPDFHTFGGDGGIKDIFFITRQSPVSRGTHWETTTMIDDRKTAHGQKTSVIQSELDKKLRDLKNRGYIVGHIIPLIDHSDFTPQGTGFDGLKNIILCFHK